MGKIKIGDKFTRLTVLRYSHTDDKKRKWWVCKCECGKIRTLHTGNLNTGNTKSCGCYGRDVRKATRISYNHSDITAIILGYKRHAVDRGFKWKLSREFVEKIIKRDCHYCGSMPSNRKKTKNSLGDGLLYSGIDRVNSSKNYTENNVVPCCKICNYAKSNMTTERFHEWAIRIGKKAMAEQWGNLL